MHCNFVSGFNCKFRAKVFTPLMADLCQETKEFHHSAGALMEHFLEETLTQLQIFSSDLTLKRLNGAVPSRKMFHKGIS